MPKDKGSRTKQGGEMQTPKTGLGETRGATGHDRNVGRFGSCPKRPQRQLATLRVTALAAAVLLSLAQAVTLDIPDSLYANAGDTFDVPVLVTGQVGRNIIAADLTIGFRDAVLSGTSLYRLGNAAQGWMVMANPFACSLLVAMASASPLVAGDTLLVLRMVVDAGDTSRLTILRARLNEGQVPCTTSAGKFYGFGSGIDERSAARVPRFALSPNPACGTVKFDGTNPAELVSVSGQRVLVLRTGSNDVRSLSRGAYFIRSPGSSLLEGRVILVR